MEGVQSYSKSVCKFMATQRHFRSTICTSCLNSLLSLKFKNFSLGPVFLKATDSLVWGCCGSQPFFQQLISEINLSFVIATVCNFLNLVAVVTVDDEEFDSSDISVIDLSPKKCTSVKRQRLDPSDASAPAPGCSRWGSTIAPSQNGGAQDPAVPNRRTRSKR